MIYEYFINRWCWHIGSHTIIELDKAGHTVAVVDNSVNSQPEAIRRIAKIIGHEVLFIEADCCDRESMDNIFTENKIDAVTNFVGLEAVCKSVAKPFEYYENNMNGVFVLVDVMRQHGCKNIIFSFSATIYGDPAINYSYYRRIFKGRLYQSLWLDQINDQASFHGRTEGRSRMECSPFSLLQSNWCSREQTYW